MKITIIAIPVRVADVLAMITPTGDPPFVDAVRVGNPPVMTIITAVVVMAMITVRVILAVVVGMTIPVFRPTVVNMPDAVPVPGGVRNTSIDGTKRPPIADTLPTFKVGPVKPFPNVGVDMMIVKPFWNWAVKGVPCMPMWKLGKVPTIPVPRSTFIPKMDWIMGSASCKAVATVGTIGMMKRSAFAIPVPWNIPCKPASIMCEVVLAVMPRTVGV
mmetsp:Transcript_4172/g.8961  ORF Transcript_4172/g.8961 Transcript_4172/m.8961 type:complete len:216 (+) Transcript_4172:531-1178(+)